MADETRSKIEKSYNRAMDITETMPIVPAALAENYGTTYRSCYREGNVGRFVSATKSYLRNLRKLNPTKAVKRG